MQLTPLGELVAREERGELTESELEARASINSMLEAASNQRAAFLKSMPRPVGIGDTLGPLALQGSIISDVNRAMYSVRPVDCDILGQLALAKSVAKQFAENARTMSEMINQCRTNILQGGLELGRWVHRDLLPAQDRKGPMPPSAVASLDAHFDWEFEPKFDTPLTYHEQSRFDELKAEMVSRTMEQRDAILAREELTYRERWRLYLDVLCALSDAFKLASFARPSPVQNRIELEAKRARAGAARDVKAKSDKELADRLEEAIAAVKDEQNLVLAVSENFARKIRPDVCQWLDIDPAESWPSWSLIKAKISAMKKDTKKDKSK